MKFNQSQSYRWVSQPRQFSGQQLDWRHDEQKMLSEQHLTTAEPPAMKSGLLSELLLSFQTLTRQIRHQPQNS